MSATLDASGLKCPLPVLRARKALKPLAPGEVLTVRATDPGALADFRAFCQATGHALLAHEETAGTIVLAIRKGFR